MDLISAQADLLERIRRDEPGAFEEFVDRWGGKIYAFGLRMCGEREDAKDILQETLIQAYRSLKTLEHPEAMRSWLYRVAANACLMKRRKGKFEPDREISLEDLAPGREDGEAPAEIPDPSEPADAGIAREELRATVRAAIGDLPADYRIVLLMRDIEGMSTYETAQALGLQESAVKMRLHRARLAVRKILEASMRKGGA